MTEKKSIITSKDLLILRELLEDGRRSSASISKEIDLGREIVNYRIKRLIKENLIVKFVPKLNEKALNYQEYIILLKLNLSDEVSKEQFIREHMGNKYLVWVIKSSSGWDLIVRLYAQSVHEFKAKLQEILETFSSVLANYYTIISSESLKESEKELLSKNLFDSELSNQDFTILKNETEQTQLDDKDMQIIHLLEQDARIQYKEIAEKLDISSDTVKYRIDKMKEQGVIERFTPIINFSKLGFYQYAFIIKFLYLSKKEEEEILNLLREDSRISRVLKSLNSEEYFLTAVFEKEAEAEKLKEQLMKKFSGKIATVEYFNLE